MACVLRHQNPHLRDICSEKLSYQHTVNVYGVMDRWLLTPNAICLLSVYTGIYWASAVSKSAGYACTTRSNPVACMYLGEVALGTQNKLIHADYYASNLKPGTLSTYGMGRMTPDPSGFVQMKDGVIVPCGKLMQSPDSNRLTLQYDEHIVYQVEQVRIRFVVLMKFCYKH